MSMNKALGRGARRPTGVALWIVNALMGLVGLGPGGLKLAGGFEPSSAPRRQARAPVA